MDHGCDILMLKKKWLDILPPYQGGGMIEEVKKDNITFLAVQQDLRLEHYKPQR